MGHYSRNIRAMKMRVKLIFLLFFFLSLFKDISGGVQLADPSRLWPGGKVYYRFGERFQNLKGGKQKVRKMMDYLENTLDKCIEFVEASGPSTDYVIVSDDCCGDAGFPGDMCYSHLGRLTRGKPQCVNLDRTRLEDNTIVHELLHTLGFLHEQLRPDRDEYLTVFPENIKEGQESNFKKRERGTASYFEPEDVDTQDTPFDFLSVLLYPPAFSNSPSVSKNGKHTLQYKHPLTPHWRENPHPLTAIDIVEIATAYSCKLSQDQIIQYIHMNRLANRQKIEVINKKLEDFTEIKIKQNDLQKEVEELKKEIKGSQCIQGWSKFGSSCYKLFDNNGSGFQSRDACEKECNKEGGKLTSIHSKDENDFVASLLRSNGNGALELMK